MAVMEECVQTAQPVVVLGATGFVGKAVVSALEMRGFTVSQVRAPRIGRWSGTDINQGVMDYKQMSEQLAEDFSGAATVVNAAGNPDASAKDRDLLNATNGVLPGVIAKAASIAGVPRIVHVSSAVVQGNKAILDETQIYHAFSPYAESKILGEQAVLEQGEGEVVVYRPPSVHAPDRRVTRRIAKLAKSPLSCVASPVDSPTPQALIENVGDAVAYLATTSQRPPAVVTHPWEGMTTFDLLALLSGGKSPIVLPRWFCRFLFSTASVVSRFVKQVRPNVRRLEIIWFGQSQAESWLTLSGWSPTSQRPAWQKLAIQASESKKQSPSHDGEI